MTKSSSKESSKKRKKGIKSENGGMKKEGTFPRACGLGSGWLSLATIPSSVTSAGTTVSTLGHRVGIFIISECGSQAASPQCSSSRRWEELEIVIGHLLGDSELSWFSSHQASACPL